MATEVAKLRTCQACPGVITEPSAESIRIKFDESAVVQRGGAASLAVGLPNMQEQNTEVEKEEDDGWLDDTSGGGEEEKEGGCGGGYGTVVAETSVVRIDSSSDDSASCDSNDDIVGGGSSLCDHDVNIGDDNVNLSQLAANAFAATVPVTPQPAPPSAIAVAGGVEGGGGGGREEGMLEAPSRADAKSWPSALKEHLVSKHGQVAADKMLDCEEEERQKRFSARIVLSYDGQTPVLEMAWSGDCASKQKAQHVAAHLALMHLEMHQCDGAAGRDPWSVTAAAISRFPIAQAAVSAPISPAASAPMVLLPSLDNPVVGGSPTAACGGEEGLLEVPLRADTKSWPSALREHLVSTHSKTPAEAEDMFEHKMQECENKFRARIVFKVFKDAEPLPVREMAWSGYCAQKKKAQHVAAYLAMWHLSSSGEQGMLEAPLRADAKSWPSALREHLVSRFDQAAAEEMLEFETHEREKTFSARVVLKDPNILPAREMAWSGYCAQKKKARHIAAYIALQRLQHSSL